MDPLCLFFQVCIEGHEIIFRGLAEAPARAEEEGQKPREVFFLDQGSARGGLVAMREVELVLPSEDPRQRAKPLERVR